MAFDWSAATLPSYATLQQNGVHIDPYVQESSYGAPAAGSSSGCPSWVPAQLCAIINGIPGASAMDAAVNDPMWKNGPNGELSPGAAANAATAKARGITDTTAIINGLIGGDPNKTVLANVQQTGIGAGGTNLLAQGGFILLGVLLVVLGVWAVLK